MTPLETMRQAPGWLLLGLLVVTPWAYGSTRPWTLQLFVGLAFCAAIPLLILRWRILCPPRVPLFCVGWILAQGWTMTLLPRLRYREDLGTFLRLDRGFFGFLPGTIEQSLSLPAMLRITALLAIFFAAVSLFRETCWRRRFLWLSGAAAGSVLTFGIVQRLAGAPGIFWEAWRSPGTFFATWFYHGNAAAWIYLVCPFLAAGFFIACGRRERIFFAAGVCLCFVAAWLNLSKIGFPLLVFGGLLFLTGAWRGAGWHGRWVVAGCALALVAVALFPLWSPSEKRWKDLPALLVWDNPRVLIAGATAQMLPDSGAFGFGPGTFRVALPHYTPPLGDRAPGIWRYAHQDYLQFLVEWGWLGCVPWAVLFFGGLAASARRILSPPSGTCHAESRWLDPAVVAALVPVAAHAMIDFPFQIASLQLIVVFALALAWSGPVADVQPGESAGSDPGDARITSRLRGNRAA